MKKYVFITMFLFSYLFTSQSFGQVYSKTERELLCKMDLLLESRSPTPVSFSFRKFNESHTIASFDIYSINELTSHWEITSKPPLAGDINVFSINSMNMPKTLETVPYLGGEVTVKTQWSFSFIDQNQSSLLMKENSTGLYPVVGNSKISQAPIKNSWLNLKFNLKKTLIKNLHVNLVDQVYAIDIEAKMGADVVAFKDGTVTWVEDRYGDFGCEKTNYYSSGNFIYILHKDGTESKYVHLMKGSANVVVGEQVNEGDKIAQVGRSGQAGVPHLHFSVGGMTAEGERSFPVKFYLDSSKKSWKPSIKMVINQESRSKRSE